MLILVDILEVDAEKRVRQETGYRGIRQRGVYDQNNNDGEKD